MTDKLSVYNGALRLLKERRLASLTDNAPSRYHLDNAYADALEYMLEQGEWMFASRSTSLAGTASSNRGFAYRFTKPTDFVRFIVLSESSNYFPPTENYAEDATYIYSNATTLYLTYVSNDASYGGDLTLWPSTYAKAVEAYLAQEIGPDLTKDEQTLARVGKAYEEALGIARAKDAINRVARVLDSTTDAIYKAALRLVRQRLVQNHSDKVIAQRTYDAIGVQPSQQSGGRAATLPGTATWDETDLRRLLDECYDDAVAYLLEQGLWNFAGRSLSLEPSTDVEPEFGYTYAYDRPDDFVRLMKISDNGTLYPPLEDYLMEGSYINANTSLLYMQYVSDDASYGLDKSRWPQTFKRALEAYLAVEIGPAAGMGASGMKMLRDHFGTMLRDARSKDAMNQSVERPPPGRLVRARSGYKNDGQRREPS